MDYAAYMNAVKSADFRVSNSISHGVVALFISQQFNRTSCKETAGSVNKILATTKYTNDLLAPNTRKNN